MLKKIKDGWYVQIHKIDYIQRRLRKEGDTLEPGYDYAIEGQHYALDCTAEEGKLLLEAVDEWVGILTALEARRLAAEEKRIAALEEMYADQVKAKQAIVSNPALDKMEEFKAQLVKHSDL